MDKRSRRTQRALRRRRQRQIRIGAAVVAAVVLGVGVFFVLGADSDEGPVFEIGLVEYGFEGDLEIPAGPVTISATNLGVIPHNIGIRGGPITSDLAPGASRTIDFGVLAEGTYELYCDVADHEQRGMVATLVVTAQPQPG